MRRRHPRLTLRVLMLAVAALAVASALVLPGLRPPTPPGPPWFRYIEVFRRNPDGSLNIVYTQGYRYETPPEEFDRLSEERDKFSREGSFRPRGGELPGWVGTLSRTIADAKAAGLEYRVTVPRAFKDFGEPIY